MHKLQSILTVCAVVLAVMASAFVPDGGMLERDGETGVIKIAVCTADGGQTAWFDLEAMRVVEGKMPSDEPAQTQHCPFMTANMVAVDAGDATFTSLERVAYTYRPTPSFLTVMRGQSPLSLSARGPPLSI